MSSLNKAQIIGRLGADPETRYTQGGSAVTSVRVATTEKWKDKQSGELKEATEWHSVTCFGRLAEIAGEYLRKGALVYFEGRIQTDKYEKDGIERYSTKIIASEMKILSSKQDTQPRQPSSQASAQRQAPVDDSGGFDDRDIPFRQYGWRTMA